MALAQTLSKKTIRPERLTDAQLVERARKNPDFFTYLVERWQEPLYRFVRRISYFNHEDAQDILQEVFIKVYKNLNAYDPDQKFSSWVYQITRNQTIDSIRRLKARPRTTSLENQELSKLLKSSLDLNHNIETRDSFERAKKAMGRLPLKYQEALVLRFLEEKTYEEITDIIKKPKGTVATLISRGCKLLKKELTSL